LEKREPEREGWIERRWEVLEASYGVVICVVAFSACAVVVLSLLFFNQLSAVLCLVALSHKILPQCLLPSLLFSFSMMVIASQINS
jgi:hypothetical protein